MHKKELVQRLRRHVATFDHQAGRERPSRWKGQKAFADFLAHYLDQLNIPYDEKYDFWRIEDHLPQLLVEAFEELRTGTDQAVVSFREEYEAETGHEVPNITDLGESNALHQSSAVQTTLGFMLRDVMENQWIENKIEKYCNAQYLVLQQVFDKFLRLVYRRGMGKMIDKSADRGMSGTFGKTHLRTYVLAGRVMFTFARIVDESKPSSYEKEGKLYSNEHSVSFVGEDGDPLCLGAGIQSIYADFRTALDMIEDVTTSWPADAKEQRKVFQGSKEVAVA
jgi:hypothetical protein